MDLQKRSLQVGAAAIACALVLRLAGGSVLDMVTRVIAQPAVASTILFLGTGRVVRPAEPQVPTTTAPEEEETLPPPTEPEKTLPVFSAADAELVEVNNSSGCDADIEAFLQQPLSWDLTVQAPSVLILHTHGTESYVNTENYQQTSPYRTQDPAYNMISIGQAVADKLSAGGLQVLHDTTAHDYPSYNGSYTHARESIQRYLEEYPSIRLVLDLHRDSMEDSSGKQISATVAYADQRAAQLMLVMGTDGAGFEHPAWQENMALAVKLHAQMEKLCPGICRPISLRAQRFNQDLSPGALLVEVGAAGNTRQEALAAAEVLSRAILDLAQGTQG